MKRRLIIMRHAKSSWKSNAKSDHQRPLNGRGRRTAPQVGRRLSELGWAPDLVLSSDSKRTRQTWELAAEALPEPAAVVFSQELYHGGSHTALRLLAQQRDQHQTVLLLGHNPGWESLAEELSGQDVILKTADCLLLSSPAPSWALAVESGDWAAEHFIRSRSLLDE